MILIGTPKWQLEKQIRQAWRYYKVRSGDCHVIAQRVQKRRRAGVPFAFPEEIEEYNRKAKELKVIETYIAERQKELNRRNPKRKEDLRFNIQQTERLTESLKV
jgi:hypothetical protein